MPTGATTSKEMSDAGETSQRIERLLQEVRGSVGPVAWRRVDELVTSIVDLYGRALGQLLEAVDPAARPALADDELLASLLALHGLHPLPLDARIGRTLAELAPTFGSLELLALDGTTVRLRAVDAPPIRDAAAAIERVLLEAAPELERVEVEGLREPAAAGPLVQIDLLRSRARASGG
jgi:hypothetical protein